MKKLEKEGWFCIRSAGSHSPIDIIAIKPLTEYEKLLIDKAEKLLIGKAEKDLNKIQKEASETNIITLNENGQKLAVKFIQSKKTGYLTPQERKEKEELEQKLGINIEVM